MIGISTYTPLWASLDLRVGHESLEKDYVFIKENHHLLF